MSYVLKTRVDLIRNSHNTHLNIYSLGNENFMPQLKVGIYSLGNENFMPILKVGKLLIGF